MLLSIQDLRVRFRMGRGANVAYAEAVGRGDAGVSFEVPENGTVALVGESGSGKSVTAMSILNLLPENAERQGTIRFQGRDLLAASLAELQALRGKDIACVFQDPMSSLNPVFNVGKQLCEPLMKHLKLSKAQAMVRAEELLNEVGIPEPKRRLTSYPHEMSGGQQQRVALARALAPKPSLLLLDEPFSNLDVELRERLSYEVREIIKAADTTAILVTHDQHEAFAVADEIGIMHEGRIQQWDTPYNLYHRPANRFVADFIGQGAFLRGKVLDDHRVQIELGVLDSTQPLVCCADCAGCVHGSPVDVLLRPDDLVHDDASALRAEVVHKAFRGADILYTLRLAGGARVLSLVPSHHNHAIGERIGIRLQVDHVVAYKREGEPVLDCG